eukprot:1186340-Prorocentrum_minimum.AAC.4
MLQLGGVSAGVLPQAPRARTSMTVPLTAPWVAFLLACCHKHLGLADRAGLAFKQITAAAAQAEDKYKPYMHATICIAWLRSAGAIESTQHHPRIPFPIKQNKRVAFYTYVVIGLRRLLGRELAASLGLADILLIYFTYVEHRAACGVRAGHFDARAKRQKEPGGGAQLAGERSQPPKARVPAAPPLQDQPAARGALTLSRKVATLSTLGQPPMARVPAVPPL